MKLARLYPAARIEVVGFMFDTAMTKVTLIEKGQNKPAHLAGKLNGIGGKKDDEKDRTIQITMAREFLEETGVETHPANWIHYLNYHAIDKTTGETYMINFFYTFGTDAAFKSIKQMEAEIPQIVKIVDVFYNRNWAKQMHNLPWLISMALTFASEQESARIFELSEAIDTETITQTQPKNPHDIRDILLKDN